MTGSHQGTSTMAFVIIAITLVCPLILQPIRCSLSPPESQDLLVTLKGLHQTLSKLVDTLSTSKDHHHQRSAYGGRSNGRTSSSEHTIAPPSSSISTRNNGPKKPAISDGKSLSNGSDRGSSGNGLITGGDYPSQDRSGIRSGSPVRKSPGQRPFQVNKNKRKLLLYSTTDNPLRCLLFPGMFTQFSDQTFSECLEIYQICNKIAFKHSF